MIELSNSELVAKLLKEKTTQSEVEEFWALALNPQCRLLSARMLFRGSVDQCSFHPRDVFRFALLQNASFLVVGHNHPSGCSLPSQEDIRITQRLMAISRLLQIPVLDHVIVNGENEIFFSFVRAKKDKFKGCIGFPAP